MSSDGIFFSHELEGKRDDVYEPTIMSMNGICINRNQRVVLSVFIVRLIYFFLQYEARAGDLRDYFLQGWRVTLSC